VRVLTGRGSAAQIFVSTSLPARSRTTLADSQLSWSVTNDLADAMSKPTRLQRWLDLIAYLAGRQLPVSGDRLLSDIPGYAEGWLSETRREQESARRTFERDKDELRKAGIPIISVKYTINYGAEEVDGYQLRARDFYLPYLRLLEAGSPHSTSVHRTAQVSISDAEGQLALSALRRVVHVPGFPLAREARSAFRKLAFDLDPNAFAPTAPVLFVDQPGAAEVSATLKVLTDALLARKRVHFEYHGIYRGEPTQRAVALYGLLFQHGHWYAIGHDATRDAVRVFRIGRMRGAEVNPARPAKRDYEIPAGFALDQYADRTAWELGDPEEEPVRAVVRFAFPLSLWAERNDHGELRERLADGGQVREFELHQVPPFLRWVLSLGREAEILEPPQLAAELRDLARNVARKHGRVDA